MNKLKEKSTTSTKEVVKNEGIKKLTLRQLAKIKAEQKAIEFLGVKVVNGKEIKPSTKIVKAQTTVEMYIDKDERTLQETKLLTNALSKTDNLSASKVYSRMISSTLLHEYFLELAGKKEIPTFKDFVSHLPVKFAYSEWDILGALSKMNPKHKINAKIDRQNKATAKK